MLFSLSFYFLLFSFAVLLDEIKIAVNSSASFIRSFNNSSFTIPDSTNNSIQNKDSSASSATITIFAIKSAGDFALHAL
jgi:hypothetical protein